MELLRRRNNCLGTVMGGLWHNNSMRLSGRLMGLGMGLLLSSLCLAMAFSAQDFSEGPLRFEPYTAQELDLWKLEARRLLRSQSVISPDRGAYAYTEVTYLPSHRQTMAQLFLVPVTPAPQSVEALPSEIGQSGIPTASEYADRYNPDKTLRLRQTLLRVGFDRVVPFEFRTLTVVDWSASGQRLLVKHRSGVLHIGLRTTDLVIYDRKKGTVSIYPEIQRVIRHYWINQGNLPYIDELAWDIQPLGWVPGSDSLILLKAWAYDKHEKKFLGLWQYDVSAERSHLVSLSDQSMTVASNGWAMKPLSPEQQYGSGNPLMSQLHKLQKLKWWQKSP